MGRQLSNHFLRCLSAEDRALLSRHLQPVELSAGNTLYAHHRDIEHVHFPRSGIVSLTIPFTDGRSGEFGLLGSNTIVGGAAALGEPEALHNAVVQIAGSADRIAKTQLSRAAEESRTLRDTVRIHEQALMAQTFQIAACNAVHALPERLSRWLLQCRDLLRTDHMPLTHEFLATMLGVRRPSVTLVLGELQQAKLVRSHRGHVDIVDLDGLRRASCECYAEIAAQLQRLIGWGPDTESCV